MSFASKFQGVRNSQNTSAFKKQTLVQINDNIYITKFDIH